MVEFILFDKSLEMEVQTSRVLLRMFGLIFQKKTFFRPKFEAIALWHFSPQSLIVKSTETEKWNFLNNGTPT